MKLPDFLKLEKDNSVVFNQAGELRFFVPEYFFESKYARYEGKYINILGTFAYDITDVNGKSKGLKNFRLPTRFTTEPSYITKQDGITEKLDPKTKYNVLHYTKGAKVFTQTHTAQAVEHMEDFFKLFIISGKIPPTIPYDKLHEYFLKSYTLNGESYDLNIQYLGLLLGMVCRDKNDDTKPFRIGKTKKEGKLTEYESVPIKECPKYISPYASLTAENWNDSMVNSIMMDEKDIKGSPLEKVMMA